VVPFLLSVGTAGEALALNQQQWKGRCTMFSYVLLDVVKREQAEKIRQAELERLSVTADKEDRRPSILKSLLHMLRES